MMFFTKISLWLALIFIYFINIFVTNAFLPSMALHAADLFSLLVFVAFVLEVLRNPSFAFPVKYAIFAGVLLSLILVSAVINSQSLGSLFLGIKTYFFYIPFFLLPFAVRLSDAEVKSFLVALLIIAFLQSPLAVFQRFVQFGAHMHTGDYITGTVGISSFLSMFVVSAIALLIGFYLRKKLSLAFVMAGFIVLFLPTTINETKGTLIILPLAILTPAVANTIFTGRFMLLIPIGVLGAATLSVFLMIFNQFEQANFDRTLGDRDLLAYTFQDKDFKVTEKESPVAGVLATHEEKEVGRGDSFVFAFQLQARAISTLFAGKGLGNLTETSIDFLKGEIDRYRHLKPTYTLASRVMWELGVIGLFMVAVIYGMVLNDTWVVAKNGSGFASNLALGWLGVIAVMGFSMIYKDLIYAKVLSAFFWFFCGYIASIRIPQGNGAHKMTNNSATSIA